MADVYNKVTGEYVRSVHTPDFSSDPDWLINPSLAAVEGVPRRYWKVEFDNIVEMTQAEKDNKDAEIAAAITANRKAQAEALFNNDPTLLAVTKLMFKEINKLRVANGDAAYTVAQFNAALQNEIDASV
jgi:hypothetical protein